MLPDMLLIRALTEKRPLTGVCLSGGGPRAFIASFGQLRALHALGLLEKIDYLSAVSGSSWLSSIVTYAKADHKTILGDYIDPKDWTEADWYQPPPPGSAASTIFDCTNETMKDNLRQFYCCFVLSYLFGLAPF